MKKSNIEKATEAIKSEITELKRAKRLKVKTLLKHFGHVKRSEDISTKITESLADVGLVITPSIMKIGEQWLVNLEDQVYISLRLTNIIEKEQTDSLPTKWEEDKWFEELKKRTFRTEKEVENKFIIPLLYKLGYSENDRYDGMSVKGAHGSKSINLEVDFAMFNTNNDLLKDNVLLVVEAKKEFRLTKTVELIKARNQTKSYGMWVSCKYGLITDGYKIEVLDLFPSIGGINVVFECLKEDLKEKFGELYNIVNKEKLSNLYLKNL